jgi:hypothetical protein
LPIGAETSSSKLISFDDGSFTIVKVTEWCRHRFISTLCLKDPGEKNFLEK